MKQNLQISKLIQLTGHNGSVYHLSDCINTPWFISLGGDGWIVKWAKDGSESNGNLLATVDGKIFSGCYLPDQSMLVAGDFEGDVYWMDLHINQVISRIRHHKSSVFDLKYDGNALYSAGADGFLVKWDVDKLYPVESVRLSSKALRSMYLDEEQKKLYIGSSDGNIYIVDQITLGIVGKIEKVHQNSVFTVCKHSDNYLFSGGRDAVLVKTPLLPSGSEIKINAHWYTINKIIVIPDTDLLITASRDKTFRIWDARNLTLIKSIDMHKSGHVNSINTVLYVPENETLITAGDDRSVIIWKLDF